MKWQYGPSQLRRTAGPPTTAPIGEPLEAHWRALLIAVVVYAWLLRLLYSAQVQLLPEETYYWNYSRHLDIGYLDHPPLVAWLIRAGTTLFGETEFGVRCGALLCGALTAFFVFRLTRNVFGERAALLALLLAQVLPFFFLAGTLMTPDAPLTAAWAASLYFLERALVAGRSRAWLCAGVALGTGLLSKYTIALVGMSALLCVALEPGSRRWFWRWEPYAAVLIAGLLFSPVILWNAHHDWASFAFQTSRRLADRPQFALHKLLGGALVLITPTGLLTVGAAFLYAKPQPPSAALARAWRLLQVSLGLPLGVFCLFSLRHEVKLDWTGAPWIAALPVMAVGLSESGGLGTRRMARWLRAAWPPTVMFLLLFYSVGFYYLVVGIPGVGYSRHMELLPIGWRELGRQVDALATDVRSKYGRESLVVGMDRYAIASELAFYSHDQQAAISATSTAHLFGGVGLMYEQWFPPRLEQGRSMLLVAWDTESLATPLLQGYADRLEPIHEGVLERNGSLVHRYYFRILHGYHGQPFPAR